ncbi:MAG: alanine--glyoxylate aminotransferase family protein [Candidatus Omnitrophica bacterium]|nr:alanine--glyoxylate aminotransferase family protein [Candidatus Omnitrophota bacterium]
MKRRYLMTPGPSPVPSIVREALAAEIMHHRTDEFIEILKEINEGLKYVFCTKNPVLTFASSGTGAMEAAVTNLFSAKDKVLVIVGGKFGERWAEIAKSYGLDAIQMDVASGSEPSADAVKKILDENKDIKGIFTTLCETSTATVFDIKGIGSLTKDKNILLIVDAISGLGQDALLTDEWGVDIVVSGSQKGFMLPPGLSFMSVSEKAKGFMAKSTLPKYYFSLAKALKAYEKNDTPFTPGVNLIVGLKTSIALVKKDGIENMWANFKKMSLAAQAAAQALGLQVFSKCPSSSLTAIVAPSGINAKDVVKKLRKEYGVSIAAGQGELEQKIFRIAHMGWINEQDLIMCFSLLEKVLRDSGYTNFKIGASVAKLQEVIYG